MEQTSNDCRFRIYCWKIRFKTEVCTCSQFPTEALHWIKEEEMVESVDDLKSSSRVRGIQENQSGGTKGPGRGRFPSWKKDCLLDL